MPIRQEPQRGFVGRIGFGGVDEQHLVQVARWVERLLLNGEIADEGMVVGLGSRGPTLHVVFGPPGPKLHRPDGQFADKRRELLVRLGAFCVRAWCKGLGTKRLVH